MMDRMSVLQNTDALTLLRIISLKLKLKADQDIKGLGINSTQGRTLDYIYFHQEDGLIQKDIAKAFNKKDATITSLLKGLEKKGYISRYIPENNERQKNIYLTEQGEALIKDARKVLLDQQDDFYDILTEEEIETLTKLLIKINTNI